MRCQNNRPPAREASLWRPQPLTKCHIDPGTGSSRTTTSWATRSRRRMPPDRPCRCVPFTQPNRLEKRVAVTLGLERRKTCLKLKCLARVK